MFERYDLALLLKEVEEDEKIGASTQKEATQDDIQRLIAEMNTAKEEKK